MHDPTDPQHPLGPHDPHDPSGPQTRLADDSVIQGPWAQPEARKARSPWLRRALLLALTVAMLAIGALIALRSPGGWQNAGARMAEFKPYFVALHLALIAWLWWKWEALVTWLTQRKGSSPELRELALGFKHRALAMLIAIELLVVLQWPFAWFR